MDDLAVPEDDGFFQVVAGLELDTTGADDAVQVGQHGQAVYIAVEALTQAIASLHATSDVLAILAGKYDYAQEVLREGPLAFLYDVGHGGQDKLALLDQLTEWETSGFVGDLGEALGSWLEAHHMPEHIHLWVNLPVLGFMPIMVGYGSQANLEMPIPLDSLFPDKD